LLFSFLKYIFGIVANSFWDHLIQNLNWRNLRSVHIFPTRKSKKKLSWKHSLPVNKYLFLRNIYVCPLWIFIFDTDQAQNNSVGAEDTEGSAGTDLEIRETK
jgi:hypothetical protein